MLCLFLVFFLLLLLVGITGTTATITIIELTTSTITTTLKNKKENILFYFLRSWNLRIQVERIQHQLHLVCHIHFDDNLVDLYQRAVMMIEHYQLNIFKNKIENLIVSMSYFV